MKKIVLSLLFLILIFPNVAFGDDLIEDYLDISANYCVIGDYNSALEYLDKILAIDSSNKQANDLKKGLLHIMAKDKKTYITGVNLAIKQASEYKRVGDERSETSSLIEATKGENAYLGYYFLGNYFRDRNDYTDALDAYNNATSARPDFAQAYLASAITLFEIGRYESALNPIDKYLTFNPNDDLAYAIKSRAEFELGMLEQSEKDNDTAIQLNNCPEYQFDRAKILYKKAQYQEAKTIFKELLPEMQTSKMYEYIGYCDYALGDYPNALLDIDRALILSNDDVFLENKYNEIKSLLENGKNE